jgi:hypothetical protein
MIPLDQVTVLGSNARVLGFPAVARISRLGLVPGALHLEVDHANPWPAVALAPGEDAVQAATLWVFLQIDGNWFATGAERLRPGQIAGDDKPEDANVDNFIAVSWLFDVNRWGPMAGYVPKMGEHVGMMVAAGSTRSDDNTPVEERTQVMEFAWPGAQGSSNIQALWIEGQTEPDVPPGGTGGTTTPDTPTTPDLLARLDAMNQKLDALAQQADANTAKIQALIEQAVQNAEASAAKTPKKPKPKP